MAVEAPSPGVQLVTVTAAAEGQRLDNFLLARLKGVPRSHVYRILRTGEVRVNKGRVRADYRLRVGDLVRIPPVRLADPREPGQAPSVLLRDLGSAILYEDERLLAVAKPAGLAVHGGSGLSFGLIEAMRQLRPGLELELVHRLDRDTSGCLLLAKRASTLRDLHRLIRDQAVEKRYLALLTQALPRPELIVEAPLRKNTLKSGERVVRVDRVDGKPSHTRFRRLRRLPGPGGDLDLVEALLVTGRTHQIRVHAAHLGAPLAGDEKYGDEVANKALRPWGLRRLFLHAAVLKLHPSHLAEPLVIQAPLPADLQALLTRLEQRANKE
ncbi:MAG: RluA family pseudouridine synthase [Chromatiaceae bacterium]|jgi:23S rRNA pseudouridine955/2504/2580 synthase|nr:RluA family pseudouridine synthase [Candidatus Thioaporhodococcus sediminis]